MQIVTPGVRAIHSHYDFFLTQEVGSKIVQMVALRCGIPTSAHQFQPAVVNSIFKIEVR